MIELDAAKKAEVDAVKAKVQGMDYNGVSVSLTEDNQNGISSVDGAIAKATKFGQSLYPLNFNARTANGTERIVFADQSSWDMFCLQFMQARQAFFQ